MSLLTPSVTILVLFVLIKKTTPLMDLSPFNISESSYISSIAVISNRAFLTLPKSSCFNKNKKGETSIPTLIEVPFQKSSDFWTNSIPRFSLNLGDFQGSEKNCYQIQDAIAIVADKFRSRLWILDKGNENCPPKVFTCHLFYNNYQVYQIPEFPNETFKNRLISLILYKSDHLFIGFEDLNRLLVFSIKDNHWSILDLVNPDGNFEISTQFLALNPKNSTYLYLTGSTQREIFTLNLKSALVGENASVEVEKVGEKLGNSSGLISDFKDGLSYFLTRDYVVIRWDTRKPSTAEYVSVLGQSFERLPFVNQLFTGPQLGVWALVNPGPYSTNNNNCNKIKIKERVVKLLKYNNF